MASHEQPQHHAAENGDADDSNHNHQHLAKKPKLSLITAAEIASEFTHHDPSVARINNGSFGSSPASVLDAQRRWQLLFLRQPDHFFASLLRPAIDRSRQLLVPLINASHADEISLVDNATTATAIVLQHVSRSFHENRFRKGDAAVILHYAYGAVKKSVQAYVSRAGGYVFEVPLPFPVYSNDDIIAEFRNALGKAKLENRRVRLAVIDHITSMPSVVIPVKELIKICREEGVDQVFVDGAHAIGCTKVDMEEIGADFYTSNLHKWLFAPPSVAFLYCRKVCEFDDVHHPVVSHEYGNGLPVESAWIGTRDYSSQLVVPELLEFLDRFEGGVEGIMKRNHDKVIEMGEMLANAWGTHLGCAPEMCSSMIMVGLPLCLGIASEGDALKLRCHLRNKFGVEVPIYYRPPIEGEINPLTGYARISHQVYNTVDDYHKFRDAVNQLVNDDITCTLLAN
ncbi:Probable L-cysteine desulfhydrase, chloroplastic [Dionaea muscipula]